MTKSICYCFRTERNRLLAQGHAVIIVYNGQCDLKCSGTRDCLGGSFTLGDRPVVEIPLVVGDAAVRIGRAAGVKCDGGSALSIGEGGDRRLLLA